MVDGARQPDSSVSGYDETTNRNLVGLSGSGNVSQTETVGDDIYHSSGAVIGNWTTASTIQRTITEGLSRDSNQTDRTEYRYNAGNQQFIPNTRTLIKTHTISDSATDDHGYSSQHDSQTSWYTVSFKSAPRPMCLIASTGCGSIHMSRR